MFQKPTKIIVLIGVLSLLLLCFGQANPTRPGNSRPMGSVKVSISREGGRAIYKIDSKPVSDPLRSLEELYRTQGENAEVLLFFDLDSTLRDVYEARVLASKAGFTRIRPFIKNSASGFMSEITFGSSIPSQ